MSTLVIARTPLQAWIAQTIVHDEHLRPFDLVYITHEDSSEDRRLYDRLEALSRESYYIFERYKVFDFINHLSVFRRLPRSIFTDTYEIILMASIDAPVPSSIISRNKSANLMTFDDGIANIVTSGIYQSNSLSMRQKLLRLALSAPSMKELKRRIVRHYSLFPGLPNIVEPFRVTSVNLLRGNQPISNGLKPIKYFIGQPLHGIFTREQIKKISIYLNLLDIDFYVRHPREMGYPLIDVPLMDKKGLLAEEAILLNSGNRPTEIYTCFSAAAFILRAYVCKSILIIPDDFRLSSDIASAANSLGVQVVNL